jgi:hypothetical protein
LTFLFQGLPLVKITSILLVIEPSQTMFDRVSAHFGSWRPVVKSENFDMDIIHKEFCCKNNILVLPKQYGTLDSEFILTQARTRINT